MSLLLCIQMVLQNSVILLQFVANGKSPINKSGRFTNNLLFLYKNACLRSKFTGPRPEPAKSSLHHNLYV
jgi:hypothetical protein